MPSRATTSLLSTAKPGRERSRGPRAPAVDLRRAAEVAAIRLPDIAAQLATYTGWNLYMRPFPEGELCDRDGSHSAFASTRAEREKAGDPRLSLQERYGSHPVYVERVKTAVERLIETRLLLREDGDANIARASSDAVKKRFAP